MLGAIHLSGDVFINVMCTVALFSCAVFSCVRKRMVRTGFRNYKPAGRKGGATTIRALKSALRSIEYDWDAFYQKILIE